MITIFGASGFIGTHLHKYFRDRKENVIGTFYKKYSDDLTYFDISKIDESESNKLLNCDTAILLSGISKIDYIKSNYDYSFKTNVTSTLKLIDELRTRNIYFVFFSTDQVFDGVKGNYIESDFTNPVHEYGRFKILIENHIRQKKANSLIVRIPKIYSTDPKDNTFFTKMVSDLKDKKILKFADDHIFTPLEIEDLLIAIENIIKLKPTGTLHISSKDNISYLTFAKAIANKLAIDENKISSCSINELGLIEKRPLNISLCADKLKNITGLSFDSKITNKLSTIKL